MIKEFIPYNLALALKELGFDEPCFKKYIAGCLWSNPIAPEVYENIPLNSSDCLAPLYQQAFRWFREKYKMDSVIIRSFSMTNSYHYNIVIDQDYGNDLQSTSIPNRTYQQAELECLKKLIEIVKNK
jgi:hypothetical protein